MADVSSTLPSWSVTASSNLPADATTVGAGLADNFQEVQAVIRGWLAHKGSDIASASTTDIGAVIGLFHDITGTTTITGFGTVSAGIWKILKFEGILTLTYNATSLILPGAANITTAVGDMLMATSEGSGNWRVNWYTSAASSPSSLIPQNSKSVAYTTVLSDIGKHILHPTSDNNARTFTIDSNANVAYPIGTAITFVNQIHTVTIAITSDTMTLAGAGTTGSRTLAASGIATALKVSTTGWIISGTGLT
jgi:hypothetical protein